MVQKKYPYGWLSVVGWVAWLALAVFGGWGLIDRFLYGHRLADYSSYVPWGHWVAAYIYFIGLSAGAFLLSSLVYVFGVRQLERIAKLSLFTAIVTLLMALVTIWFDLGHLERFFYVFTRPNFHSMMAWMVWLYTAYFILLVVELYYAIRKDAVSDAALKARYQRYLTWLGGIGIPLAVAFHGGVGALFATVIARDLWHTPIYPILFLTGALLSGGALMTVVVAYFWPNRSPAWRETVGYLGKVVLGLLLLDALLEWAEYSIPMWYGIGAEYDKLMYVLFGPFWWNFWIVHVLLGVLIPLVLLVWYRKPLGIALASLLITVTFFAVRLNLVIPGLVFPELRGLERSYTDPIPPVNRLSFDYLPSVFEWQIFFGVIAMGIALFYIGYRWLPLVTDKEVA
ncbi:NrfD/PsrC family molybdoenzyme membrane anchor subunit [Oceanithermus desulfurans]